MLVQNETEAELHIAIYRTSSIGDTVLASVCLNALDRLAIPVKVYWFGREPSLSLLQAAYPCLSCFEVNRADASNAIEKCFSSIKRLDAIVDLQKNLRSHIICAALAKQYKARPVSWKKRGLQRSILIMRGRFIGRSQAASTSLLKPSTYQFEAMRDALLKSLTPLKAKLPQQWDSIVSLGVPTLPTKHDAQQRSWQKELRYGHWIALAPGASYPTKQAPFELYSEILAQLERRNLLSFSEGKGVGLVFLGDENDRQVALKILAGTPWPFPVLNLAGKLSLWESALALSQTKIMLSNDSSLAHIAEAVGTPVAVLFGPTVEAFGFAPRMPESRSFSSLLGCRPCSKHGKLACRYNDLLCFRSIHLPAASSFLYETLSRRANHD